MYFSRSGNGFSGVRSSPSKPSCPPDTIISGADGIINGDHIGAEGSPKKEVDFSDVFGGPPKFALMILGSQSRPASPANINAEVSTNLSRSSSLAESELPAALADSSLACNNTNLMSGNPNESIKKTGRPTSCGSNNHINNIRSNSMSSISATFGDVDFPVSPPLQISSSSPETYNVPKHASLENQSPFQLSPVSKVHGTQVAVKVPVQNTSWTASRRDIHNENVNFKRNMSVHGSKLDFPATTVGSSIQTISKDDHVHREGVENIDNPKGNYCKVDLQRYFERSMTSTTNNNKYNSKQYKTHFTSKPPHATSFPTEQKRWFSQTVATKPSSANTAYSISNSSASDCEDYFIEIRVDDTLPSERVGSAVSTKNEFGYSNELLTPESASSSQRKFKSWKDWASELPANCSSKIMPTNNTPLTERIAAANISSEKKNNLSTHLKDWMELLDVKHVNKDKLQEDLHAAVTDSKNADLEGEERVLQTFSANAWKINEQRGMACEDKSRFSNTLQEDVDMHSTHQISKDEKVAIDNGDKHRKHRGPKDATIGNIDWVRDVTGGTSAKCWANYNTSSLDGIASKYPDSLNQPVRITEGEVNTAGNEENLSERTSNFYKVGSIW